MSITSFPTAKAIPVLITYEEAARRLGGVSIRHVERLVKARKLRRKGSNKARRIVESSLIRYIEREDDDG
jgi:excisionase family DNA binding protein